MFTISLVVLENVTFFKVGWEMFRRFEAETRDVYFKMRNVINK